MANKSCCESVNVDKVPNIIINSYMECPICLEFAVSPIYSCTGGHIICGICQAKTDIQYCPVCQSANLSINAVLERILKSEEIKIDCRNAHQGCTLKVQPCDMKVHLEKECDFRPVKCIGSGAAGCEGESYTPHDLLKHLIVVHEMHMRKASPSRKLLLENISNPIGTFDVIRAVSRTLFNEMNTDPTTTCSWKTSYFPLDHTIFFHCGLKNKTVHLWITLLGEESDAQLYNYTATVSSSLSNSEKKTMQFHEVPIHTVQYSDLDKVEPLGHTVSISCDILKLLHDQDPIDPETIFEWTTKFEIFKVRQSPLNTGECPSNGATSLSDELPTS